MSGRWLSAAGWRRLSPSLALSLALLATACEAPTAAARGPGESFEFGVFYGGQVQERDEIPFELDASRQRIGFRLTLSPPPAAPVEVRWELGRPGAGRRTTDGQGRKARPRKVQLGLAHFRPGEAVLEQHVAFSPGDPTGLWNIRVLVGSRVVIDRPFLVYDPAERARRQPAGSGADAGL
jgi:hypothetical protein